MRSLHNDSIPDLEAEERATYYTARSVPVDSAALYEAVNRYVDSLVAHEGAFSARSENAMTVAHRKMIAEAYILAQSRYAQRRAQQTEVGQ